MCADMIPLDKIKNRILTFSEVAELLEVQRTVVAGYAIPVLTIGKTGRHSLPGIMKME